MDSQKRRRLIMQQALKLQELRQGRDNSQTLPKRAASKSRILKTEHSHTVPRLMQNQNHQHQQTSIDYDVDDLVQRGECKVIFLQRNPEDIGFKTFTEMMRTNSSWLTHAPKLNPALSPPAQIKNRLQFNQTQALRFKHIIDKKWNSTVQQVSESIIQKQHEDKQQTKMKIIQMKINHIEQLEEQDEPEAPTPSVQSQEIIASCLKFFWFHIQISDWKPPIREGCTVTYIQSMNKCFMYGGIGNDLFKTFVTLNTQSWSWRDIGPGIGDVPLEGRFGHTSTIYKSQIIIFGGEKKYNTAMKIRECYSDVRIFSPLDKTWINLKTFGDILEGRRNHCAICVGKFFIIYGGINSYGKIMNDVCALNLETGKCQQLLVENYTNDGVSDASSLGLFKGEVKMENPYFSYEYHKKKGRWPKVNVEGIYIFGGRLQNGEAVNELRIIQFGTKPIKIIKAKTKGIAPQPRYSHSMNFYLDLNSIIVYGGRNDSKQGNILNDIFVLQADSLNWVQVSQIGQLKYGKSSHCSVSIDSKLLIFGGYTQNVYANADVQLIELDQNKVGRMIKDNRNNKNKEIIISSYDLLHNNNLKVFKAEYYNEAEDPDIKQQKILENEIQKLAYNNFKSFLPLPPTHNSQLVQQYKAKREQAKLEILRQQSSNIELSRRGSRKTLSNINIGDYSRMQSKIHEAKNLEEIHEQNDN